MAPHRKTSPAQRRAGEAARRASAANRIGPREPRPPRPPRVKPLHRLKPPGTYYETWDSPGPLLLERGAEAALNEVSEKFGADSVEVALMDVMARYADVYDGQVPTLAAAHLHHLAFAGGLAEELARSTGIKAEDAVESVHRLHAMGTMLVADDGSLWLTIPPGTPVSAADGGWSFVEQKIPAQTCDDPGA
jgi:hypothetical protein